jgi:hypothetical protein
MTRSPLPAGSRLSMRGGLVFSCVIALALLGGAQCAGAAPPKSNARAATPVGRIGIVTILEGKATVVRALSQFEAAQGMRLLANDLLHTQPNGLLRIEYPDECWLELGPDTLLQLSHPAEKKRGNRPGLYLLQGWLKLGCKANPDGDGSLASGDLDVVGMSGVIVVRASGESHAVFAEQGTARVIKRRTREAAPIALNRGDFLFVVPDRAPAVQARPTADFVEALPRAYRDTLPSRYSMFVSRTVDPKEQRTFSYADVEPWLNAEASIRRQFVGLWGRKVNDPAFRGPLDRDLAMHPEWDRILHPEKYEEDVSQPTRPPSVGVKPDAAPQQQPEAPEKSVPKSN